MTTAWRQNIELFQQRKPETPFTNKEINEILVRDAHNNKIWGYDYFLLWGYQTFATHGQFDSVHLPGRELTIIIAN